MPKKIYSNKKIIHRLIWNYIFPHKFKILLALLMMTVSAAATGLHAWLVRPALDEVLINGNREMLLLIPIAIIIVTLCKGIATYLHSFQMSKIAHTIIAKLQSEMFDKLMYFNIKMRKMHFKNMFYLLLLFFFFRLRGFTNFLFSCLLKGLPPLGFFVKGMTTSSLPLLAALVPWTFQIMKKLFSK